MHQTVNHFAKHLVAVLQMSKIVPKSFKDRAARPICQYNVPVIQKYKLY